MKRLGLIITSILLVAAMLLSLMQRNLLPVFFDLFTAGPGGEEAVPLQLEEGDPATGGKAAEDAETTATSIKNLARQITAEAGDDYDKLVAIYDWVTANITYDLEKAKNIGEYGYGAEYLFETRKGVCHDYAELTRALLKAVGIKATYERGEVHPAPGKTENHAWNRALIGETWYGLDTTWGSGFIDEDKGLFVPRPSRLYLTTPEELARLHRDPEYKEACEIKQMRNRARKAKPVCLPKYEAGLLKRFNKSREEAGLASFKEETALLEITRQSAAGAAEKECRNEKYSLSELEKKVMDKSLPLRLSCFQFYLFTVWDYPTPTAKELYRQILEQSKPPAFLNDSAFTGLTVGVVRQGDLVVVILLGLSYY